MGFERGPELDWPGPTPPEGPCEPCEPRGVVPPPGVLPGELPESAPLKPRKCHGGESSTPPLADCGREPPPPPDHPGSPPPLPNSRALLASAWSPLASDVENPPPLGPDPPVGVKRVGWLVDAKGSDGEPAAFVPKPCAVPRDPTPKP